jgi:hypothetical protein
MATFFKGPLGGFSGSIGPIVGSSWKDQDVMRSQPGPRTSDPSPAQVDQQAKFALAGSFVNDVKKLLAATVPGSSNMTGFNIVLQQVLTEAVTGTSNAYSIDYSKVLLSQGELPNAFGFSVASAAAGKITWSWQASSGLGEDPTDHAVLIVYSEDLGRAAYTLSGAVRNAGTDSLTIPVFSGKQVQTWLSFISANGKEIADSVFTGHLTVQ